MKASTLHYLLVGILVILIPVDFFGMMLLRRSNYFFRAVPVCDMSALEYTFPHETPEELWQLCGEDYKETLKNVMNFVHCTSNALPTSDYIQDLFDHAKQGGMLTCNGMAELYLHALRIQGVQARKLFVVKNFGDSCQSHTIVEIFLDGKWRIFDPTFHVSFKKDGQLIGAQDIAQALVDGSFSGIEPVFYGEVAYPHRLERYYMHWLSLYNNVLLFDYGHQANTFIEKILFLPLRYWYGPVLYYLSPDGCCMGYFELLNIIYFLVVCVLPLTIIFLTLLLMVSMVIWFSKKRKFIIKKG